jgi:hypothetical protein
MCERRMTRWALSPCRSSTVDALRFRRIGTSLVVGTGRVALQGGPMSPLSGRCSRSPGHLASRAEAHCVLPGL